MIPYDFKLLYQPTPEELIHGIPQNTEHWLNARRGRVTASKRAHQILYSRDATLDLMMDRMGDEMTRPAEDGYSGKAAQHGHDFEEQAIDEYDMMRLSSGDVRKTPGMFVHPVFDIASATPDFFEGDDVTGQVKCPQMKNHLSLLHFGCRMVSANYYTQVQFEAFVTGRPKIIFISYHPDAPATNQLFIEEIEVCEKTQDKFRQRLELITHMLVNNERLGEKEKASGIDTIPLLF